MKWASSDGSQEWYWATWLTDAEPFRLPTVLPLSANCVRSCFRRERLALLVVERLVAVGAHLVRVEHQPRPAALAEAAGVEVDVEQPGVERPVRHRGVEQAFAVQRPRQQVDRAAVGRRPDGRRRSRAPLEHRRSDRLRGEERPRVVRRVVGVVERNPVVGHAVLAVLEATEERLGVAEARAVRADVERARRHLQHLAVVGHRRGVVLDVFGADQRLRRARGQRRL